MFRRNSTAIIFASLVAASTLHAETIKVPEHHPTIDAAIEAAVKGDKIVISKGTYHENIAAGLIEDLTIKANGKVVVDAGGLAFALSLTFVSGVKIQGVTFKNGSGSLVDLFAANNVRFEGCRFIDSDGNGLEVEDGSQIEIVDCLFKNVVGDGIEMYANSSYVEDSKFIDCGQTPFGTVIRAVGSYLTVQSNSILDDGTGRGIVIGEPGEKSDFALVYHNKVRDTGSAGIVTTDTVGCLVKDNVVLDAQDEAITVDSGCDNSTVDGNRVYGAAYIGIEVGADFCFVVRNTVKKSGGDGFRVFSTSEDNLFFKNKVTNSKEHGVRVIGSGNTFIKNVAKGSGTVDLMDEAGADANHYVDNTFGTSGN